MHKNHHNCLFSSFQVPAYKPELMIPLSHLFRFATFFSCSVIYLSKMVASSVLVVFRLPCFTLASCFLRAVLARLAHLNVQRHVTFPGVFFFRPALVEDHLCRQPSLGRRHQLAFRRLFADVTAFVHVFFRFSYRVVLLLIRVFSTFVCSCVCAVSYEPSTAPRTRALHLSLSVDFVHS